MPKTGLLFALMTLLLLTTAPPLLAAHHEGGAQTMPMGSEVTPEMLTQGKAIYDKVCFACHATGVAGAPKLGDKAAWKMHIEEGLDHLVGVAISGEGAMPPRGGNPALSDTEVRAAVAYMLENSK